MSDPKNTLFPKIVFFHSKGIPTEDIAKLVSTTPGVLRTSLENKIILSYNFFKEFLKSKEKTNVVVKRFARILLFDLHIYVVPNFEALREIGVPESNIVALLQDTLKLSRLTLIAIHALRAISKSTWEKKLEVYKKWGLSEDHILVAFRKYPMFMLASEDKITGIIDFFVNKMGWESSIVARRPVLVGMSLERRIIPRCLVYQILLSKGLIKKDFGLMIRMLETPKSHFLK
ncbi:uncharacterized protein LOC132301325 [Cornus florida]|uniref:uncharacterized protein LOC132301325 n=1 Tax=Cornus florida TaxID=4283 RepID=UPI0028A2C24A|nr:uncharacterized protein LOC132301325 [Cornus florida]